jgi:RNA polymerase sigma factor (sigma-70 family)
MGTVLTTGIIRASAGEDDDETDTPEKALEKASSRREPLTPQQQRLAAQYVPLARALAKPLKTSWPMERDEFDSAAMLALVEAAQSFNPSRNVKFATFARYRIWGALRDVQRSLITAGWRADLDNAPNLNSLTRDAEEYGCVIGAEPDRPVGEELESNEFVANCFNKLPAKHAEACRQIYLHGRSQSDAAAAVGCSKSRLSYLHKEALEMINDAWAYQARLEANAKDLSKH